MKLYYFPLSGHAHRAQLFLSLIGAECSLIEVDLPNGEHKREAFLKLNPFGQVPVLEDDGQYISDSNAILVYLAKKFGKTDWLPEDALQAARVQRWLSVAAGELFTGPASARLITVFGAQLDAQVTIARAHRILALIEDNLGGQAWMAGTQPTLADVALYSYIVAAPEGNVDLAAYPLIRQWLAEVEALDGFVALPRTRAGLYAQA
jgi:glutathione S-transferase